MMMGYGGQVFVAGATGRLGARIVKMLLEKNNQIKVRLPDAYLLLLLLIQLITLCFRRLPLIMYMLIITPEGVCRGRTLHSMQSELKHFAS